MTDRRPHWDDDLEQKVTALLFDCYNNGISEEQVYQVIAAVEDWQEGEHLAAMTELRGWTRTVSDAPWKVSPMSDDVWFIPLRPGMTRWEDGSTGVSIAKHCDKHYCEDWHLHIHRGAGSAGTDLTRRDVAALRDALDALLEGKSDE